MHQTVRWIDRLNIPASSSQTARSQNKADRHSYRLSDSQRVRYKSIPASSSQTARSQTRQIDIVTDCQTARESDRLVNRASLHHAVRQLEVRQGR